MSQSSLLAWLSCILSDPFFPVVTVLCLSRLHRFNLSTLLSLQPIPFIKNCGGLAKMVWGTPKQKCSSKEFISFDLESKELITLEISFDDWVELSIILFNLMRIKVFNDDWKKNHSKLFLCKVIRTRGRENKLEEFIPFFVWNKDFSKRANHIGNIFLNKCHRLILESLKQ